MTKHDELARRLRRLILRMNGQDIIPSHEETISVEEAIAWLDRQCEQAGAPKAVANKTGIPLLFGDNAKREPGKVHEEYHAPCGCAFHEQPRPHWHPCLTHLGADDNEFRRELVGAYLRDREKGLKVEFHCVGVGADCGAPLTADTVYRCGDCDQTYCLPCLKKHFAAHVAAPSAQEPDPMTLGWAVSYFCALADKGIDPRTIEVPSVLEAAQRDWSTPPPAQTGEKHP